MPEKERSAYALCLFRANSQQLTFGLFQVFTGRDDPEFLGNCAHGYRAGIGPSQSAPRRRAEACRPCLTERAGAQQLGVMKEFLDTLVIGVEGRKQLATLVRVAKELVDGLMYRVFDARAFELGHHNGDAVDEQDRIRDDMPPSTGQLDLELIYDQKAVLIRVFKIDIANRLRLAVIPVRSPSATPFEQEFGGGLVYFMSRCPDARSRSRMALSTWVSSSQGLPSRRLIRISALRQAALQENLTKVFPFSKLTSTSPSIQDHPIF